MNPDLPQFDAQNLTGNWAEITSAYELSPFILNTPVAIQIFKDGGRAVITGMLSGTEDSFSGESTEPYTSTFSFVDAENVAIQWDRVQGVVAMVALDAILKREGPSGPDADLT